MIYYPVTKKTWDKNDIRIFRGFSPKHLGIDFTPFKDPLDDIEIIASHSGRLQQLRETKPFPQKNAFYSMIKGDDGLTTFYVHSRKFLRGNGYVKAGENLALMGSTGNSTGVHVHFGVKIGNKYVDPEKFNLTFYDEINMDELFKWNDKFLTNNWTDDNVAMSSDGVPSKLVKKTDNLNADQIEIMNRLKGLTDFVEKSSQKNTSWIDLVMARNALAYRKSLDF